MKNIHKIGSKYIDISQIEAISDIYYPHKTGKFDIYTKGGNKITYISQRGGPDLFVLRHELINLWKNE